MRIKVNSMINQNIINLVDTEALKDGYTRMEMIEKIVNIHYGITDEVSERKKLCAEIKQLLVNAGFNVNIHFSNQHYPPDATGFSHIIISSDKIYSDPVALNIQIQTRDAVVRFECRTKSKKKYDRYHEYYNKNKIDFDNYSITESINNYNYVIEYRTRLYNDSNEIIKAKELADRFLFLEKMIL